MAMNRYSVISNKTLVAARDVASLLNKRCWTHNII